MKRRDFLHSLAVAPVAAMPGVQQPPPAPAPAAPAAPAPQPPATRPQIPSSTVPVLQTEVADTVAVPAPAFFTAPQMAALRRLSDILMPPIDGMPGALDTEVPAFLDFLISRSPADLQALYRTGLDTLQAQASKQFNSPFESVSAEQAESLLAPLREPWTFEAPKDPLAAFLRAAKQDVRQATQNGQAYGAAVRAAGGRGGGVGQYWYEVI